MVESDPGDVPGATITEAQQRHNCGSRFSPLDIEPGDIAPRSCPFGAKTPRPEHDRIWAAFGVDRPCSETHPEILGADQKEHEPRPARRVYRVGVTARREGRGPPVRAWRNR